MRNIRYKKNIKYAILICLVISLSNLFTGCGSNSCKHTECEWIVDVAATYDTEGKKHLECSDCNEKLDEEIIPKLTLSMSELTSKITKSLVQVYGYDYDGVTVLTQGTGFFINNTGSFITNAHVVENSYFIKVRYNSILQDVKYMHVYNRTVDYAICELTSIATTVPVEFSENVSVGDKVYAYGYPNDFLRVTVGNVVSTSTKVGVKDFYETTAEIDHGSSGGVLVDSGGRVLGITTGQLDNDNYATLKYSSFKKDISNNYYSIRTPLSYFHSVKTQPITTSYVKSEFDTYFDPKATSSKSARYSMTFMLDPIYAYKKIVLDSAYVYIQVTIKTYYTYNVYNGLYTSTKEDVDYTYLYYYFYSVSSLLAGQTQVGTSTLYVSSATNVKISYEVEMAAAMGTLLIYS